jgi:hypothetical protein
MELRLSTLTFRRLFLSNETIYGIKNTHIQQNRTDQPCG